MDLGTAAEMETSATENTLKAAVVVNVSERFGPTTLRSSPRPPPGRGLEKAALDQKVRLVHQPADMCAHVAAEVPVLPGGRAGAVDDRGIEHRPWRLAARLDAEANAQ